jgi:hypothetical protein
LDIRLLGQTEHGVYDEADNVDPALLHRYYGAAQPQGEDSHDDSDFSSDSNSTIDSTDSSSSSGSNSKSTSDSNSNFSSGSDSISASDSHDEGGSDEDEDTRAGTEDQYQAIAKVIAGAQKRNIRHDAAEVAKSAMPFENTDEMRAYTLALGNALASNNQPAGFGLNEEYESVESYKTGRSSKALIIPLPHQVWFPRIVVWCKALDLLKRLWICREVVVP